MSGLMAPPGSKERAEYEKKRSRERGFYGLMAALLEPISYVPGPIGDIAEVGKNIAERGPWEGLLSSWDVVGMPKVLRQGPAVMKMIERSPRPVTPDLSPHLKELGKDIHSPQARELFEKTGEFVNVKGDLLREYSDAGLRPTRELAADIAKAITQQGSVTKRSREWFDHPEFYARHPEAADIPVTIHPVYGNSISASYYSHPSLTWVDMNMGSKANREGILPIWAHEMEHHVQTKQGLPRGASYSAIEGDIVASLMHHGASPDEIAYMKPLIQKAAKKRYLLTEGEIGARTVERRIPLTQQELLQEYPHDAVRYAGGGLIPSGHRILNPYASDEIDRIARLLLGIPESP